MLLYNEYQIFVHLIILKYNYISCMQSVSTCTVNNGTCAKLYCLRQNNNYSLFNPLFRQINKL